MACHWIENTTTGKQEWICSDGTNPTPAPNPAPPPGNSGDLWMWPTVKPSSEHITGTYTSMYTSGGKTYQHRAVDIGIPIGNKVLAPHAGKIVIAGWDNSGYGNLVKIVFGNFSILLGHLSQVNVKVGEMVNAGDVVGLSGSTGNSTGPHIHFEVREGSGVIDPMQFFGGTPKPGVPGNPGVPNVPVPEFKPVAPDSHGVYQPTDPTNPLAKVGKKDASGNWVPINSMPSSCSGLTIAQWPEMLKCLQDRAKQAASQLTGSTSDLASGKCDPLDVGCQISLALSNLFSIPIDPALKKAYAMRWIVGSVAVIILLIALWSLININQTGRELVREYVGITKPAGTNELINRMRENIRSNGKVKS